MSPLEQRSSCARSRHFIQLVRAAGQDWTAHLPKLAKTRLSRALQPLAQEHLEHFLNRFADRIRNLTASGDWTMHYQFDASVMTASFRGFLDSVFEAACCTDHPDRHELLAELIAVATLRTHQHAILSATGPVCQGIQALASRHFRTLGLLAILMAVRPSGVIQADSRKEYRNKWLRWWNSPLETLCTPDLLSVLTQDCATLIAAGTVARVPPTWPDTPLVRVLQLRSGPQQYSPSPDWLTQLPWANTLSKLWRSGLSRILLTSPGLIIGSLYLDRFLGFRSRLELRDAAVALPAPVQSSVVVAF